jgi:hypothetical protein
MRVIEREVEGEKSVKGARMKTKNKKQKVIFEVGKQKQKTIEPI